MPSLFDNRWGIVRCGREAEHLRSRKALLHPGKVYDGSTALVAGARMEKKEPQKDF